ncbi:OTU domain, partial [Trinorchestia longiramus]
MEENFESKSRVFECLSVTCTPLRTERQVGEVFVPWGSNESPPFTHSGCHSFHLFYTETMHSHVSLDCPTPGLSWSTYSSVSIRCPAKEYSKMDVHGRIVDYVSGGQFTEFNVKELYESEKGSILTTTTLTQFTVNPSRLQLENVPYVLKVFNDKVVASLKIRGCCDTESSSNPIYTHVRSSLEDVTKSLNATLAHTLADRHCFLHAVALQLNETPNSMQVYKFLMKAIETESTRNKNYYRNFIDENSGRLDLLVQKYLHNKKFDHAAGDLIPQITSNALQKPIHIYSERDGGLWKTIVQPTMPQNTNKSPLLVHLKDYHYSALIKEKIASINKISASRRLDNNAK